LAAVAAPDNMINNLVTGAAPTTHDQVAVKPGAATAPTVADTAPTAGPTKLLPRSLPPGVVQPNEATIPVVKPAVTPTTPPKIPNDVKILDPVNQHVGLSAPGTIMVTPAVENAVATTGYTKKWNDMTDEEKRSVLNSLLSSGAPIPSLAEMNNCEITVAPRSPALQQVLKRTSEEVPEISPADMERANKTNKMSAWINTNNHYAAAFTPPGLSHQPATFQQANVGHNNFLQTQTNHHCDAVHTQVGYNIQHPNTVPLTPHKAQGLAPVDNRYVTQYATMQTDAPAGEYALVFEQYVKKYASKQIPETDNTHDFLPGLTPAHTDEDEDQKPAAAVPRSDLQPQGNDGATAAYNNELHNNESHLQPQSNAPGPSATQQDLKQVYHTQRYQNQSYQVRVPQDGIYAGVDRFIPVDRQVPYGLPNIPGQEAGIARAPPPALPQRNDNARIGAALQMTSYNQRRDFSKLRIIGYVCEDSIILIRHIKNDAHDAFNNNIRRAINNPNDNSLGEFSMICDYRDHGSGKQFYLHLEYCCLSFF
jgi:hypothetical protein